MNDINDISSEKIDEIINKPSKFLTIKLLEWILVILGGIALISIIGWIDYMSIACYKCESIDYFIPLVLFGGSYFSYWLLRRNWIIFLIIVLSFLILNSAIGFGLAHLVEIGKLSIYQLDPSRLYPSNERTSLLYILTATQYGNLFLLFATTIAMNLAIPLKLIIYSGKWFKYKIIGYTSGTIIAILFALICFLINLWLIVIIAVSIFGTPFSSLQSLLSEFILWGKKLGVSL